MIAHLEPITDADTEDLVPEFDAHAQRRSGVCDRVDPCDEKRGRAMQYWSERGNRARDRAHNESVDAEKLRGGCGGDVRQRRHERERAERDQQDWQHTDLRAQRNRKRVAYEARAA